MSTFKQVFYAMIFIGVGMLITGAIALPDALYKKKVGCDLNRKLSLDNLIIPSVAEIEYNLCQKVADTQLKWSTPVLSIGAVITGICLVLGLISYYLNKRYYDNLVRL